MKVWASCCGVLWCAAVCLGCTQEMTAEAEVISVRFTKSVIKSCAALSYHEAQARMDDK